MSRFQRHCRFNHEPEMDHYVDLVDMVMFGRKTKKGAKHTLNGALILGTKQQFGGYIDSALLRGGKGVRTSRDIICNITMYIGSAFNIHSYVTNYVF